MKKLLIAAALATLFSSCLSAPKSQPLFNGKDLGVGHSETPVAVPLAAAVDFDLQGFVDARLKTERRVVVPPGRYRVTPKHGVHLRLKDLADVEVIANNSSRHLV